MSSTQSLIDDLYNCFDVYSANDMHYCTCGCISKEDLKVLNAKPLKQLELEDLGFYHHKAMTTWGGVENYKFFLPRILDLYVSERRNAQFGIIEITSKLKEASWQQWPGNEVKIIREFVHADWKNFVLMPSAEISLSEFKSYSVLLDGGTLLNSWDTTNPEGMKNFVDFIYDNGNSLLIFHSVKDQKNPGMVFRKYLQESNIVEELHKEFFKYASSQPDYAEKVSIVLQLIEGNNGFS